ncbi:MAG: invasion associated locus B family protein [Hyphomicrobium sp.]
MHSAKRVALAVGPAAAFAAAVVFGSASLVVAQEAKDAAKPAAPAAAAPAKPAAAAAAPAKADAKGAVSEEAKTAWHKICAKVPIAKKEADGKAVKEDKNACTTFYESFNPATGAPLVYVAVEEGEGIEKKVLTVVVPPGLALPPGMAITVFQKDQWEKFVKENKEGTVVKPEDVGLKPIELKYLHCHQTGCASVSELQGDFLELMKTGVGVIVRAVELSNKVIDFPVPLKGFVEAYGGPAVDTKAFMEKRNSSLKEMADRRAELIEQFKKVRADEKADAAKAGGAKPAAPAAAKPAPAAAPAAAPAEKK